MKIAFTIFLLSIIFNASPLRSQEKRIQLSRTGQKNLVSAYSYLWAQDYSVEKLKEKFPKYIDRIELNRRKFYRSFGFAIDTIRKVINSNVSKDSIELFKTGLVSQFESMLSRNGIDEVFCQNFIDELEKRSRGIIVSPILETLLFYQYIRNPEEEFLDGHRFTYKTIGHPKAKGTDWQVEIPKSWKAEEGVRPDIVQKFVSTNADNLVIATMAVSEIPIEGNQGLSEHEIEMFFTEKEMQSIIPKGSTYISGKSIKLDGYPAGLIEFEQIEQRVEAKAKIRMRQYIFIRRNKIYFFQCGVMTFDLSESLL